MMERHIVETKKGAALGFKFKMNKLPFMMVVADKGYMVANYFDQKVLEKVNDSAVLFTNVKSFPEMLRAKPAYVSKKAQKLGIKKTMTGKQVLDEFID
ncbi:MAG: DUF1805 domain-containing protein [DPANN group archaeon]|nr:DUF1805 domain-containing protein [DPANN group archaeon]